MFNRVILENDRIMLLPFENSRNKELKHIAFDSKIWNYMGMEIKTAKDLENYIADTVKKENNQISHAFLIIDKTTNQVAGSTRYGNINTQNKRCEIGWTWLGRSFQGIGINKAVKYELLCYAFEVLAFNRIQFSADIENLRSQRAIEKLGATKEGVFRNNYVNTQGESRTDVYYSIIKDEWNTVKENFFGEYL